MTSQIKRLRNSNLELYRIFCMVLIVLHHLVLHGLDESGAGIGINKYIIDILSFGGKIGVSGFVLISGYFMVNSHYSVKKYLRLEGQVLFYSVMALLISIFLSGTVYIANTIKAFFPVLLSQYWFVTSFVALMILSPFLNYIIQSLKKEQYRKVLIVLVMFCSVMPTFISSELSNSLTWFIFLYFIAGYIRFYKNDLTKERAGRHAFIAIFGIVILWCSSIAVNWLGMHLENERILLYSRHFMSRESVFGLLIAYELFMFFLCRKPAYHHAINQIAGATFGVYLIHDNANIRSFLWDFVIRYINQSHPLYLIISCMFYVALVYILCTIVELARQYTIEKIWIKWIDQYADKGSQKLLYRFGKIIVFLKEKYNHFTQIK